MPHRRRSHFSKPPPAALFDCHDGFTASLLFVIQHCQAHLWKIARRGLVILGQATRSALPLRLYLTAFSCYSFPFHYCLRGLDTSRIRASQTCRLPYPAAGRSPTRSMTSARTGGGSGILLASRIRGENELADVKRWTGQIHLVCILLVGTRSLSSERGLWC